MQFLALILGLAIERLLTQLFHLRAFHWLDPIFDQAFAKTLGRSARRALALREHWLQRSEQLDPNSCQCL